MPKEITFHVGLPKCGSTAIQTVCAHNRTALLEGGVLYPDVPNPKKQRPAGHLMLSKPLTEETADGTRGDAIFQRLVEEFAASGARHMLFSSENFIKRATRFISTRTAELLKPYEVNAILFIRRRDQWLKSCYKREVFTYTRTHSFAEYLQLPAVRKFRLIPSIQAVQKTFAVDNIHIIDLDLDGADAVRSVSDLIGFDLEQLTKSYAGPSRKNRLAFERGGRINAALPDDMFLVLLECKRFGITRELRQQLYLALYDVCFDRPESRLELLSPELSHSLLADGAAERRQLAEDFGARMTEPVPAERRAGASYRQRLSRDEFDAIVREIEPSLSEELLSLVRRTSEAMPG